MGVGQAVSALLLAWSVLILQPVPQYCTGVEEGPPGAFSAKQSLIWGPGLQAGVTLPVRYFFIQARDELGRNLTESLGEEPAFTVEVTEGGGGRVRVWAQVLDRHDGSYVVRMRLMQNYGAGLVVSVLRARLHVAQSPYHLSEPVYHELCYCPEPDLDTFLQRLDCPSSYEQIERDLAPFPSPLNMSSIVAELMLRYNRPGQHSLCHYVIRDNVVFRRTQGEHVGFKMFMDSLLLSLTRKVRLPDLEFILNLGDWPLEERRMGRPAQPLFSWCGSKDAYDVVLPTYDLTESTLETMGRVSLDMLSVQAHAGPSWEHKSSVAFWRGRDSRQERLDLVRLSLAHPELVDARLTNMFFFPHTPDLGPVVKSVPFTDFFAHKYQVSLDGTVAAYRLPYLLAGRDSVVLKQDSPYYEHFYARLQPYTHYIPVLRNLSNLLEQVRWAREHDAQAREIGREGRTFVQDNLMARDIFCYHALLLRAYAARLDPASLTDPTRRSADMERVDQPSSDQPPCTCHRSTSSGRDEL